MGNWECYQLEFDAVQTPDIVTQNVPDFSAAEPEMMTCVMTLHYIFIVPVYIVNIYLTGNCLFSYNLFLSSFFTL